MSRLHKVADIVLVCVSDDDGTEDEDDADDVDAPESGQVIFVH